MHSRNLPILATTIAAAVGLAHLGVSSQVAADDSLQPALQILQSRVDAGEIPGAAVLVLKEGRVLARSAYGVCDVETMRPFRPETICWIASLTKPVTAAAAMTLVDRGVLNLDDPVEKHLPAFAAQTTADGRHFPVTLRQLMSHSSGIQTPVPTRPQHFFDSVWLERSLSEVADAIPHTHLIDTPGEQVQYSNAAPYVLGRIVEVRAGIPFGEYVRKQVLAPLEMNDTGFSIPPEKVPRAAVVYRRTADGLTPFCRYDPSWQVRMAMPDGGLFSTVQDMSRFAQMFLEESNDVLSPPSVESMLSQQSEGYGLGWILDVPGQFSHWGSSGTLIWGDRRTKVVGVVFFQVQDQRRVDAIQKEFRARVSALTQGD